jgi:aspartate aminotransferase-like enzyme
MSGQPRSDDDDNDLLEYSVIYTDRAKNLMAASFSQAFKDISTELCAVYQADHCVLIPGSGSYAMEAVVGQFARHKSEPNYQPCLVIRNGYFSFRWSDIWDWVFPSTCGRSPELKVVKATAVGEPGDQHRPSFQPPTLEAAVAQIKEHQPCVVFAPHVETSDGILLSDDYIKALADATHANGGPDAIFVLDCIASGNLWAKMKDLGVDVLITAPQKGWTSPASVGIALMSARAKDIMNKKVRGHSFCCNLSKWSQVADKYATPGGFMYHTTLPTDALMTFRDVILETKKAGLEQLQTKTVELGTRVRAVLESKGFQSVAADGCQAPTVVVSYMRGGALGEQDKTIAAKFKKHGIQIAAGVPLKIDEPWGGDSGGPPTFRIGLFGLDKLQDVDKAVKVFEDALDKVLAEDL